MSEALWYAFALMLVLEGVLPFASPERWRRLFAQLLQMPDAQIRVMGLVSMMAGVLLLSLLAA